MVQNIWHSHWEEIKIHTAKCDKCDKHNKSIMYRCTDGCSRQICTPCKQADPQNGRHRMHASVRRYRFIPRATRQTIASAPAPRRPLRRQTIAPESANRRPLRVQTSRVQAAKRRNATKETEEIYEDSGSTMEEYDKDVLQRNGSYETACVNMTPRAAAVKAKSKIAATSTRRRRSSSGTPPPNRRRKTLSESLPGTSASSSIAPWTSPIAVSRVTKVAIADMHGLDLLGQAVDMMATVKPPNQFSLNNEEVSSTGSSHQDGQRQSPVMVEETATSIGHLSYTEANASSLSLETFASVESEFQHGQNGSPLMVAIEMEDPLDSQESLDPVTIAGKSHGSRSQEVEVPDSQPSVQDSVTASLNEAHTAIVGPLQVSYDPSTDIARLTVVNRGGRQSLFMSQVRLPNGTLFEYPSSPSSQE